LQSKLEESQPHGEQLRTQIEELLAALANVQEQV
jgi:hypothetical protein